MANNTGNPVGADGSGDPRDFVDNVPNFDKAVNGEGTWNDRLGVERPTLPKVLADYPLASTFAAEAEASAASASSDAAAASTDADRAEAAAADADVSAATALATGYVFVSTAGGVAGTPTEQMFLVTTADAQVYQRYVNNAGTAVRQLPDFSVASQTDLQKTQRQFFVQGSQGEATHVEPDKEGRALSWIDAKTGERWSNGSRVSEARQRFAGVGRGNLALQSGTLGAESLAALRADIIVEDGTPPTFNDYEKLIPYGSISGTHIQRIPAVLKIADDELLLFWGAGAVGFNGDGEGVTMYRMNIKYSPDGKVKEKTAPELFRAPLQPSGVIKHPMLCKTSTGRILLAYDAREEVGASLDTILQVSDDNGETFSAPVTLSVGTATGSSGRIIQMESGRIVLPIWYFSITRTPVGCLYSDDDGETWTASTTDIAPLPGSTNENAVVEYEPGKLLFVARYSGNSIVRAIYRSLDAGVTVTYEGNEPDLGGYVTSVSLLKTRDRILYSGPSDLRAGFRARHRLVASFDGGETWKVRSGMFEDDRYIGYTCLEDLGGGLFCMAYEGDRIISINFNESIGLVFFSGSEVYNNVRSH